MLIFIWVTILLIVIFAIGVRVGQFMSDKGVPTPTPISETPEYLSIVENILLKEARSDRSKPVQKQPE